MRHLLLTVLLGAIPVFAASPEVTAYLDSLHTEVKQSDPAFTGFDAKRGEQIFTSSHIGKRGEKVSCTSCHNVNLTASGKNIVTGKMIDPLAPSANPLRLSSVKEVKKWLRRNFKDVYNREGTALEKGDVLTYIDSK